eukprot:TRINITY_DN16461_c0_g1_i2.p1 TRINITY_DN16461_c0_g1~~TRINITY_DN16461_c0_g1_i2.p1  ORF type:complete len:586 (-),score=81.04 TRINITY_DN16461_c0_g1_i2:579-2336(-)
MAFRTARAAKSKPEVPIDEMKHNTAMKWSELLSDDDQLAIWLKLPFPQRQGSLQKAFTSMGFSFLTVSIQDLLPALEEKNTSSITGLIVHFLDKRAFGKVLPQVSMHGDYFALYKREVCEIVIKPINWHIIDVFLPDWHPDIVADVPGKRAIAAALPIGLQELEGLDPIVARDALGVLADCSAAYSSWLMEIAQSVAQNLQSFFAQLFSDNGYYDTPVQVEILGSVVAGIGHPGSDVDMVVLSPSLCSRWSMAIEIANALQTQSWATVICCALETNHPVITIAISLESFPPPPNTMVLNAALENLGLPPCSDQGSSLQIDISVNDQLGVLNSQLLGEMIRTNEQSRATCAYVKFWSKAHNLNNPKQGTLSSYSWRLVVLSYLLQHGVVPCLREGFADLVEPPCNDGINTFWQKGVTHPPVEIPTLELLLGLFRHLKSSEKKTFHVLSAKNIDVEGLVEKMKFTPHPYSHVWHETAGVVILDEPVYYDTVAMMLSDWVFLIPQQGGGQEGEEMQVHELAAGKYRCVLPRPILTAKQLLADWVTRNHSGPVIVLSSKQSHLLSYHIGLRNPHCLLWASPPRMQLLQV